MCCDHAVRSYFVQDALERLGGPIAVLPLAGRNAARRDLSLSPSRLRLDEGTDGRL